MELHGYALRTTAAVMGARRGFKRTADELGVVTEDYVRYHYTKHVDPDFHSGKLRLALAVFVSGT